MKGPKQFSPEEIEANRQEAELLEKDLDAVEKDAQFASETICCLTDSFEILAEQYIDTHGLTGIVTICINDDVPFSEMHHNILSREMQLQLAEGANPRRVTGENVHDLQGMIDEYAEKVQVLKTSVEQVRVQRYTTLLELTLMHEPFVQEELKDKAIIFIVDHEKDGLVRAEYHFSNNTVVSASETDVLRENTFDAETIAKMTREAKRLDANAYIIHNPSSQVRGKDMLNGALRYLFAMHHGMDPSNVGGILYIRADFLQNMVGALDDMVDGMVSKVHPGENAGQDVAGVIVPTLKEYEQICPSCPMMGGCGKYARAGEEYGRPGRKPGQKQPSSSQALSVREQLEIDIALRIHENKIGNGEPN